jgi:hypothetical protein
MYAFRNGTESEGTKYSEDLGVDMRIILKWSLDK